MNLFLQLAAYIICQIHNLGDYERQASPLEISSWSVIILTANTTVHGVHHVVT